MVTFWILSFTITKRSVLLNNLNKVLDTYCQYDKVLLSGEFNSKISENYSDRFLYHYLKNLMKDVCVTLVAYILF